MLIFWAGVTSTYIYFKSLWYSKSPDIFISQKEVADAEEAGVSQGVVERKEDVARHEVAVVAGETFEVTVVAEAFEVVEVLTMVVVGVVVDTGDAVVDFEAHDMVFVYVRYVPSPVSMKASMWYHRDN